MIRRIRPANPASPIVEYEVQTPTGSLRLRPSEVCALAESIEKWFAGHRDQLVDDLAEERCAQSRLRTRPRSWPTSPAPAAH